MAFPLSFYGLIFERPVLVLGLLLPSVVDVKNVSFMNFNEGIRLHLLGANYGGT